MDPFTPVEVWLTTLSLDWAARPRDAWVYGIVIGWTEDELVEVAARHGWIPAKVDQLRRLRAAYLERAQARKTA